MKKTSNNQILADYRNFVECHIAKKGRERAEDDAIRMLSEAYAKEHQIAPHKAVEAIKRIVDYKTGSDADYGSFQ